MSGPSEHSQLPSSRRWRRSLLCDHLRLERDGEKAMLLPERWRRRAVPFAHSNHAVRPASPHLYGAGAVKGAGERWINPLNISTNCKGNSTCEGRPVTWRSISVCRLTPWRPGETPASGFKSARQRHYRLVLSSGVKIGDSRKRLKIRDLRYGRPNQRRLYARNVPSASFTACRSNASGSKCPPTHSATSACSGCFSSARMCRFL